MNPIPSPFLKHEAPRPFWATPPLSSHLGLFFSFRGCPCVFSCFRKCKPKQNPNGAIFGIQILLRRLSRSLSPFPKTQLAKKKAPFLGINIPIPPPPLPPQKRERAFPARFLHFKKPNPQHMAPFFGIKIPPQPPPKKKRRKESAFSARLLHFFARAEAGAHRGPPQPQHPGDAPNGLVGRGRAGLPARLRASDFGSHGETEKKKPRETAAGREMKRKPKKAPKARSGSTPPAFVGTFRICFPFLTSCVSGLSTFWEDFFGQSTQEVSVWSTFKGRAKLT